MNEGELIVRLQQKDESAFRQLVEGWKDRTYNTALGLLQQEQDAEDITQEVFVAVWRTVDEFRGGSSVGTWLYRITVSKSLDLIRKKKRKKRLAFVKSLLGQTDRQENEIPEFSHPGVVLEKKEDAMLLFASIRKLPEQQQIAYNLRKMEDLSISEIASILNISISAVESLLQRAKMNLRKTLTAHFEKNEQS